MLCSIGASQSSKSIFFMGAAGVVLGFCFQQWDIRICILWYIQGVILLSFDVPWTS